MNFITKYTLPTLLNHTFSNYLNNKGFSFVGGQQNSYADLKKSINRVANLLKQLDVQKGDRVAILAVNSPDWVATYMAAGAIGAVVVPILPDFSVREIAQILTHSEAKAVFASEKLVEKLPENSSAYFIKIENREILNHSDKVIADSCEDFAYADVSEEDLLAIIYTSGTTGTSKGVMLTHKNILWNVRQCKIMQAVGEQDRYLSILPLSHTYENTLGMLTGFASGSATYYLDKLPTPSVLMPALAQVKPTIMLSVPLVIEKIYKNKILKEINSKKLTKFLYKIRPFQKILHKVAGKKLYETFGGQLHFFGVGGAKLSSSVERFLLDANFPYAIGYGMTETAPLLAGAVGKNRKVGSAGIKVEDIELRLVKEKPEDATGEIQVKGLNVMQGYYKAPDLTAEVFTEDGWLRTGDLGEFDQQGMLSIKGRIKTMIVGSSGENIYPEEIESVINKMDLVQESLVTEKGGKLVAMVHLNMEELEKKAKTLQENMKSLKDDAVQHTDEAKKYLEEKAEKALKEMRALVNQELNKFSQIQQMILHPTPFEKTPTQKIKRFLYNLNKSHNDSLFGKKKKDKGE